MHENKNEKPSRLHQSLTKLYKARQHSCHIMEETGLTLTISPTETQVTCFSEIITISSPFAL